MADTLLFRGGSTSDVNASTVQSRELVIDTTTDKIVSGPNKLRTVMEQPDGNVGIGTTTPQAKLGITAYGEGVSDAIVLNNFTSGSVGTAINAGKALVLGADYRNNSPNAQSYISFETDTTEKVRIDSAGRFLVGTSSALGNVYINETKVSPSVQIEGTTGGSSVLCITGQEGAAANIILQRGVAGTPVEIDDNIGQVNFNGFDGTNFRTAAQINAEVDGTPGTNDMPGRLVFSTAADGASSPTERMRIKSDGTINYSNVAVYADNTAALAGGLVAGDMYRKSDGTLMITF